MGGSKHEQPVERREDHLFPTPQPPQVDTQRFDDYRVGSCNVQQYKSCDLQTQRSVTVDTGNGCYDIRGNNVNVYIYQDGQFRQEGHAGQQHRLYRQERYIPEQSNYLYDREYERLRYQQEQYVYGRQYDRYPYQQPVIYRDDQYAYEDRLYRPYMPNYRRNGYPYYAGGNDMIDIGSPLGRVRAVTDDGYGADSGIDRFINLAYKGLGLAAGFSIVKNMFNGRSNNSYYGGNNWLGGLLGNYGGYGNYGYRQPYYYS
jgi:hypothetical protein